MSEILEKIAKGNMRAGAFFVNHEFHGENGLTDFENIYNQYNNQGDVVLEFSFCNSYYFFAKYYDEKAKKQSLRSFEYIDENDV